MEIETLVSEGPFRTPTIGLGLEHRETRQVKPFYNQYIHLNGVRHLVTTTL